MEILSVAFSAVFAVIGFSFLLSKRMKGIVFLLLLAYIFLIYAFMDNSLGQWKTFFLVSGSIIIVFAGTGKSLLDTLLSLTGYLVMTLVDYLFSVLRTWSGFPLQTLYVRHPVPFQLIVIFIGALLLLLLRRFYLYPKYATLEKAPPKLLFCFLIVVYLAILLMVFNFVYGKSFYYPTKQLIFNGFLIIVLALCTVLVFFNMSELLEREQALSLQQARLSVMQDYTERMEHLYEEMRAFRHDYKNILSTMEYYIDSGDMTSLQSYFHAKIQSHNPMLSSDSFILGKLHLIADPALKSLLYTKLISMLNHRLTIILEIAEPVEIFSMDNLTLCRVLGILLDNAIEAAVCGKEQKISLAVVSAEEAVHFVVGNDTLPISIPTSRLFEKGYSTKEGHSGLGLSTVRELIDPLPNVFLSTEYEDSYFRQTLTIQRR
ncbi:MAG: GHKL domain-containing protein [Acetatifactor sp.]|nr:GHKL domain-containing protein [Acetatifactor sp.]